MANLDHLLDEIEHQWLACPTNRASLEKSKEDLVKSLIKHQLSGPDSQDADVDDALDSFMQNVEEQLGVDQVL